MIRGIKRMLSLALCLCLALTVAGGARAASFSTDGLPYLDELGTAKVTTAKSVVYTGPGSDYYRSASGKATVDKGASVRVYGVEGDWVLIRYNAVISSRNLKITRCAFISRDCLSSAFAVDELEWAWIPISIQNGAKLVDEPSTTHNYNSFDSIDYRNAYALAWIVENGQTWIYFEANAVSSQGNRPFRGFVPIGYVSER